MLKNTCPGLTIVLLALLSAAQAEENGGQFIRLVAALDEPEYYCLDLAGWGAHLQLDDPLQAHTCKNRGAEDQKFHFSNEQLKVSLYDRCVQVAGSSGNTLAGSAIIARACSDSPLQRLSLDDNGRLRIGDTGLCLGAGAESAEASGPSHMWRSLSAVHCDSADGELATWQVGLE